MWTDKTSGLEFYPPPLVFFLPADILATSKWKEFHRNFMLSVNHHWLISCAEVPNIQLWWSWDVSHFLSDGLNVFIWFQTQINPHIISFTGTLDLTCWVVVQLCVRGAFCNQAACGFLIIGFIRRQTTARNRDFTHGKGSNDHICPVRGIRYPYLMCLVLCFHLLFRANLLLQFQLQRLKLLVTPCLQD